MQGKSILRGRRTKTQWSSGGQGNPPLPSAGGQALCSAEVMWLVPPLIHLRPQIQLVEELRLKTYSSDSSAVISNLL